LSIAQWPAVSLVSPPAENSGDGVTKMLLTFSGGCALFTARNAARRLKEVMFKNTCNVDIRFSTFVQNTAPKKFIRAFEP
jgi:hypothetical protein